MQSIKLFSSSRFINCSIKRYAVVNFISRNNSTTPKRDLVLVDVNNKTGVAIVTLNSPPVNSLNLELLSAFAKTLDDLKTNNSRGMILTSVRIKSFFDIFGESPKMFCC
jgi:hypothetical protein